MNSLIIYQVDAFTDHVFGGNPAAVCILNNWLPSVIMQNIAAENNLSETAFLVKESNQYHIRWFTPTVEVDLCGHATLASAQVLFQYGLAVEQEITFFSERSGTLSVSKNNEGLLTLNFPADHLTEMEKSEELLSCFDIEPMHIYKGKTDYMMIFDTEQDVIDIKPNFDLIKAIDCRGIIVTAKGNSVDFVSRFFAPQSGVDEDPVTGSAHTTLTPYWSKVLDKKVLSAQQLSERLGILKVEDAGDRVKISGTAVVYLKGEIYF
ncbi:MAG: PhzF family phenazine biosynthesis protein [Bacteroidetes bacterium]|nr:PhzF family phenazine biosynthesis protein [Bacteroidota bacterium]MBU1372607.1 PhzF family phenazine biosynthesis protein [Bacteroidota bacterium]MBU1484803.1 PhzF family phenazine biosynthesis protein [Bacteroidota bacterium]MBU1762024.1 PhzF family phenazine biosynthesis protein [Bacteroidota bacterium]MBU2046895.1 PhzF family phenazine biosynthesis protein [Bacteroidota bacterium]